MVRENPVHDWEGLCQWSGQEGAHPDDVRTGYKGLEANSDWILSFQVRKGQRIARAHG